MFSRLRFIVCLLACSAAVQAQTSRLKFSGYYSGSGADTAQAIGRDAQGNIYVAGTTVSGDLVLNGDSAQGVPGGAQDVFLFKFDPTGTILLYGTYFGGTSNETLSAMVVDAAGNVFLTGTTNSIDMPVTSNATQSSNKGGLEVFVTWIDPSRTGRDGFVYSTYLGGGAADQGLGLAVDDSKRIYVTGATLSDDFPVGGNLTQGSRAGSQDAFFTIIDGNSGAVVLSTYFGGGGWDVGRAIAIGPDGNVWIAGQTASGDLPVTSNAYQSAYAGALDGFVARFDPNLGGSGSLIYSTFISGTGLDDAKEIAIDSRGRAYVAGVTQSNDLPVTGNAIQTARAGGSDVFLVVIDPSIGAGQLAYSGYLGGNGGDVPYGLALDSAGNVYLTGFTLSTNFPLTGGALQTAPGPVMDAFLMKLTPAATGKWSLSYSTYLSSAGQQVANGMIVDNAGVAYIAGYTTGELFDSLGGPTRPAGKGKVILFYCGIDTAPAR